MYTCIVPAGQNEYIFNFKTCSIPNSIPCYITSTFSGYQSRFYCLQNLSLFLFINKIPRSRTNFTKNIQAGRKPQESKHVSRIWFILSDSKYFENNLLL